MPIIDAQIHIWSQGTTMPPHRAGLFTAEQALADMDAAGIDGALLHPPSWDPHANEVALEAVRAYPNRFAIFGQLALDQPESRKLIEGWKSRPGMLGLRFAFIRPETQSWPHDGTIDWMWPAAEKAGIPVALLCGEFLPLIGQKAERHPQLKLIVDHMATVRGKKGDEAFGNMTELLALAKHPNIAVKLSGGPAYATDGYPFKSLEKHYRRIYDAFGPKRMFWGTDITRMPCSWRQCITHITEELHWLSAADKDQIMGDALCDWIGWNRTA